MPSHSRYTLSAPWARAPVLPDVAVPCFKHWKQLRLDLKNLDFYLFSVPIPKSLRSMESELLTWKMGKLMLPQRVCRRLNVSFKTPIQ